MKRLFLFSTILLTLLTIMNSCDSPNSKTIKNDIQIDYTKPFPGKEYIQAVDSSVMQFSVTVSSKKNSESWEGHCSLYCNKGDLSYLVLPLHCFPYDSTKEYRIWATDFKKKKVELSWVRAVSSTQYDAEVIVVKKIKGLPTLCERGMIGKEPIIGDSAVLLVPFNARNVHQKFGLLCKNNEIEMNVLFGESGDSGGLVIGRNGVIGITVSITDNGKNMQFVPINIFEELYTSIANDRKDPI